VLGHQNRKISRTVISKIALAKDKNEYQLALFEFVSKANDTHANLWSSLDARPPVGKCALPVTLRFAEGRNVVEVPGGNIRK
jgi:hypothetical protein